MLKISGVQRQLTTALISGFSYFIVGGLLGWPAPTLKKLREPDSPIPLTPLEEAWVVNALYITMILCTLPSGTLMNTVGRKTTVLILCASPTVFWVLVYFAQTGFVLIVARAIAGLLSGGFQTVMSIYVAEIAEPRVRGIATTFSMVNLFAGTIFMYAVGPYVSVPMMALISAQFPILFFVLFLFCPESPYFYVMRGRPRAARKALAWLRGGAPIETELNIIQTSIENESKASNGYFTRMLNLITNPANRKAFFIVEAMTCLQRFSGMSCLIAFSTVILPKRVGPLTNDQCTLIMGLVWLLSSILCTALVDRVGRKPLLYLSSIGVFVSMLSTTVWYYLDRETSTDVTGVSWVPFAGFLVFGFTFTVGIGCIVPAYAGEMFPSNLKAQGSALTTIAAAASSTISTTLFAVITVHVGLYANFLVFATAGLANGVFTYYFVIETKGKSLQKIQEELNYGSEKNLRIDWKEQGTGVPDTDERI